MTRKHFVAIAVALKELREVTHNEEASDSAARAIAEVCAESNSRFDMGRFLQACGV